MHNYSLLLAIVFCLITERLPGCFILTGDAENAGQENAGLSKAALCTIKGGDRGGFRGRPGCPDTLA